MRELLTPALNPSRGLVLVFVLVFLGFVLLLQSSHQEWPTQSITITLRIQEWGEVISQWLQNDSLKPVTPFLPCFLCQVRIQ